MAKRKRIAFLVGQAAEYYQADVLTGFQEEAIHNDYDVCVFAMFEKYQSTRAREAGETSIFDLIPYEDFDGIVLMLDTVQTPGCADHIEEMVKTRAKCPVISIDKDTDGIKSLFPNHYDGIKTLVTHLIEDHGVKDIAFLTGKSWHPYSKERLQAFLDTMQEYNLPINKDRIFYGDFWYTSGESLGDKIKKFDNPPEAVVCANDCMAIGLCKSLISHGFRIPEDIKVIGYDSNDEGRFAPLPITSVTIPAKAFGKYAAESIHNLIRGRSVDKFRAPIDVFYGCTCGCNNESAVPKVTLRNSWDTDISANSIYSTFNHMDEDLLTQTTFSGLINTIYSYIYQIREFDSFHLCLNENWETYGKVGEERMGKKFSDRINHILCCGEENKNVDRVGMEYFFDKRDLIPELNEDREEARCYFFTPMHFEDLCFGYAVISFLKPQSYSDGYRIWLRGVMRGLEYFRRQDALRESNARLEASLVRDTMTGLFNYRGFESVCEDIIEKNKSKFAGVGVLAIDIKELSKINDSDGRGMGDKAISNMARFLTKTFENGMSFCIGNGEFIVIMGVKTEQPKEIEEGLEVLKGMVADYNLKSTATSELNFHYGIEVGQPNNKEEFESLVAITINKKNAQKINMQKLSNSEILTEEEQQEAQIVNEILDKNKIAYHFQPIIDARTGDIFAYEALMRAEVTPYLAPPVVLRYAEFFDRLYDVEKATFNNVINILNNNIDDFAEDSKIFINSIPNQILKGADRVHMQEMVAKNNGRIVVELTEQAEITDSDLFEMKSTYESMGIETAVDDYGTGYSNVTNLLRYMPNYVKIDRLLLSDIQNSPQKQHFVKEIVTFAHDNGILALAEGVETYEELQCVIRLEVDLIQGYYVGKPNKNVIKEIAPEIRQEILTINREEFESRQKNVYIAGREGRISLPGLEKDGYKSIVVTNGQFTYKNFTIAGVPGLVTDMNVEIQDGYQGRIVLDNCGFTGNKSGTAISIGDGCDVTLVVAGENNFTGGGIRVAESSRLVIEGDGSLNIDSHEFESTGIGNEFDKKHGSLIFDLDGTINIKVSGTKAIGIGSGLGGEINIRQGKYIIEIAGQKAVGIGSFYGDIKPNIKKCALEIDSKAITAVGVGSFKGSVDLLMEKNAVNIKTIGDEAIAIGSFIGKNLDVYINHSYVSINAMVQKMMGVGSFESETVNLAFEQISIASTIVGKDSSFVGSFNDVAKIKSISSLLECTLTTDRTEDLCAREENIVNEKGRTRVFVNGTEHHRVAE